MAFYGTPAPTPVPVSPAQRVFTGIDIAFAATSGTIEGTITTPVVAAAGVGVFAPGADPSQGAAPILWIDAVDLGTGTSWSYSMPGVPNGNYDLYAAIYLTPDTSGPPDMLASPAPAHVNVAGNTVTQNFVQCPVGYTGPLCADCANGYAPTGDGHCEVAAGYGSISGAIATQSPLSTPPSVMLFDTMPDESTNPIAFIPAQGTPNPLRWTYTFANLGDLTPGYYVLSLADVLGNNGPDPSTQSDDVMAWYGATESNPGPIAVPIAAPLRTITGADITFGPFANLPSGAIEGTVTTPPVFSVNIGIFTAPMGPGVNPSFMVSATNEGGGTSWSYTIPNVADGTYYGYAFVYTTNHGGPPDVLAQPAPANITVAGSATVANFVLPAGSISGTVTVVASMRPSDQVFVLVTRDGNLVARIEASPSGGGIFTYRAPYLIDADYAVSSYVSRDDAPVAGSAVLQAGVSNGTSSPSSVDFTIRGACTASCDDQIPCTTDSCDVADGCGHEANTNPCDDEDACTTGDTCAGGTCQGGPALPCDDDVDCTTDTCDSALGCQHAPTPGSCNDGLPCTTDTCTPTGCLNAPNANPCDDRNACTSGDTCAGGACQPGAPTTCNDDVPCTIDACDPTSGCSNTPSDAACDDSDLCTQDRCTLGGCTNDVNPCGDDNPCTTDTCGPATGCVSAPNANPCDDHNACTSGDTCAGGACQPGAPNTCNDDVSCTIDTCDPTTGCAHTPNDWPCVDGNPCTNDRCDVTTGCEHTNNATACNDHDACTLTDRCVGGTCTGSGVRPCNDDKPCTEDRCDPQRGCVHDPNNDACNDNNACTSVDLCAGGDCIGAAGLDCDDSDPCTTDSCNPASGCDHEGACDDDNTCTEDMCDINGACTHTPLFEALPCDDFDACTSNDACANGACVGQGPPSCDDDNPCTVDSCDEATGDCLHAGACNDGIFCTDDICTPGASGVTCEHIPNTNQCNDGDPCTPVDACSNGACAGSGAAPSCDDRDDCTEDMCVPMEGCKHEPDTGGSCDDHDVCSLGGHLPRRTLCRHLGGPERDPVHRLQWVHPQRRVRGRRVRRRQPGHLHATRRVPRCRDLRSRDGTLFEPGSLVLLPAAAVHDHRRARRVVHGRADVDLRRGRCARGVHGARIPGRRARRCPAVPGRLLLRGRRVLDQERHLHHHRRRFGVVRDRHALAARPRQHRPDAGQVRPCVPAERRLRPGAGGRHVPGLEGGAGHQVHGRVGSRRGRHDRLLRR